MATGRRGLAVSLTGCCDKSLAAVKVSLVSLHLLNPFQNVSAMLLKGDANAILHLWTVDHIAG